ncbi:MAG: signal peptidase I [Coriobacteriia bacterium]|nr:signal peptidase I [Coriobacteriia bacterium]
MQNVSGIHNAHASEVIEENASSAEAGRKNLGQTPSLRRDLLFLLIKIASIIGAFLLLFTFVFGITRYQEASMFPAIKDGDLVIFYRHSPEHYISQDVVAVKLEGQTQFRRVVATAGDTVDITENGLVINGAPQQESGIIRKTERYVEGVSFPLVVPQGQVFVLGDNRSDSLDSRIYGCVETEDILGKVMMIIRKRGI